MSVFLGMKLCIPLKVNQQFEGAYHTSLQGLRAEQKWNRHRSSVKLKTACIPMTGRHRQYAPTKRRLTFSGEHSVISQRIGIYVTKAVRASVTPTYISQNRHDHVRFDVFTAVIMKNDVFWDVTPCGSLRTDVSEKRSVSFIRITRISELGKTLPPATEAGTLCSYFRNFKNVKIKNAKPKFRLSFCLNISLWRKFLPLNTWPNYLSSEANWRHELP
jgi:hypothetical protein